MFRWNILTSYRARIAVQFRTHTTATAVMHTGQTWAGMSGLTGVHMSLVCNDSTLCIQETNDFYAMGPDGVRWYGGSSSTPGGRHYMTSLTNPEWLMKNPVSLGTMMGGGMGYQTPSNGRWR